MTPQKRVLFVEDEPEFQALLRYKFENDVDGMFVYTGGEALAQLQHSRWDVVVLDVMMLMDGVTIVQLANGRLRNSKVYFLSCLSREEVEKRIEKIKDRVCGIFDKQDTDLLRKEILDEETLQ